MRRLRAPRRARRDLGIDSEALGTRFVPIRGRSCAVPVALSARGGTQPNASRSVANAQAEAPPVGLGRGFCLAHARVSEVRRPPRHSVSASDGTRSILLVFITPCKDTSSTRARAAAPAPRARRVGRAAVGDAAAPFRWLTGSMDGGGSRRSLVFPSRLAPQCHGWRRSSRRMRSPGRLVRAFGGGPPPHAGTQHRPARPPCTACPTRRAPSRSQVVRWSWPCAAAHSRARCRLRQGLSRALCSP